MIQAFNQSEPNLVNDPIEVLSDTTLSLPETLSLPSSPSLTQISQTPFPSNFPTNLDTRYRENSTINIHIRLDWNKFIAPPPLFGQHHQSNRLHNWAHNIQILTQDILTIKFEIALRRNNRRHHPSPLAPPNKTAQPLSPPFMTT